MSTDADGLSCVEAVARDLTGDTNLMFYKTGRPLPLCCLIHWRKLKPAGHVLVVSMVRLLIHYLGLSQAPGGPAGC